MKYAPKSSPAENSKPRWAAAILLSLASGALPYTISGFPEFVAIVLVPFVWVAILRGSIQRLPVIRQMSVCATVAFLHPWVRLLSSSWHDGFNWFVYLLRVDRGYQREVVITLGLPIMIAMISVVMLHFLDPKRWRRHADAS